LQVQCEVYEQKNFDLTEENKSLALKYSEAESNLNKFEKDNLRLTKEVCINFIIITIIIKNNMIY